MAPNRNLLTFLLLAFVSTSLSALDNEGLKKLREAGLDDETIILKMQQEPAEYDLSTDGLIDLKEAGISNEIIQAALKLDAGEPVSSSSSSSSGTGAGAVKGQGGFASQEFPSVMAPEANPEIGKRYFTRVTFFHEGGKHIATNYSRGAVVPINTEVEYVKSKKKFFEIALVDTGETITMVNVPEYTNETTASLPSRYLSEQKTQLEKLPEDVVTAVETGELRLGMTKELALMTRGFPPAHVTPNTKMDRWTYWSSRFVQLTVVFRNDRLVEGRGLY